MKELHKFDVFVDTKVKKTEKTIDGGQTIEKTTEVTEKVAHKIVLKRPARHENDKLRLFYGSSIKRALDNGLISKSTLVNKHIDGVGALLSKETAKRLLDLSNIVEGSKNELLLLATSDAADKSTKQHAILVSMLDAQRELQAIESSNQTIFNNTAESYAQERSVLWLILMQTYVEKDGKTEPLFKGADFEKREEYSFDLEDSDNALYLAARDWVVTFWGYYGRGLISTPEEFAKLETEIKKAQDADKVESEPLPSPVPDVLVGEIKKELVTEMP